MSRIMSWFERASDRMSPRDVRNFFSVSFKRVGFRVAEHAGHGHHFLRIVFRFANVARGIRFPS